MKAEQEIFKIVKLKKRRTANFDLNFLSQPVVEQVRKFHKSFPMYHPTPLINLSDTAKELQYRNLLYTAITRAKELLIIIGKPYILQQMTQNHRKQLRYSGIKYFLEELNG